MATKRRINPKPIIALGVAFAAVAGVSKCTSWAFYEEYQAEKIYRIHEIDPDWGGSDDGLIYAIDASINENEQWVLENDRDAFSFDLNHYPPNALVVGMCFHPIITGSFQAGSNDLEQLNPVPCPTAE